LTTTDLGGDPALGTASAPAERDRTTGPMVRLRQLDLRNTWQVMAGAILLPLGIAVIILGWHGAAYGNVDQKQIPYLISGGVLGLAIVLVGCFFYWAHWLYRIYDQADLHHQQQIEEQRELFRSLIEAIAVSTAVGRPDGQGLPVPTNGSLPSRVFVATATGTNFHTAGCPMVANKGAGLRTITEDEAATMKPCRICEPVVNSN
jgi:hypothetical protein